MDKKDVRKLILLYKKNHDTKALTILMEAFEGLIYWIVYKRFKRLMRYVDIEDIKAEAKACFIELALTYNHRRKMSFLSYIHRFLPLRLCSKFQKPKLVEIPAPDLLDLTEAPIPANQDPDYLALIQNLTIKEKDALTLPLRRWASKYHSTTHQARKIRTTIRKQALKISR